MAVNRPHETAEAGALLRGLIESHVSPERHDSALQVATRLLESSLTTSPSVQTANSLTKAMLFRLVRDGKHEEASRLATITTGLKLQRGLQQNAIWPVLYVLNDLRGTADQVGEKPIPSVRKQLGKPDKAGLVSRYEDSVTSPPSTEIVPEADANAASALVASIDQSHRLRQMSASTFEPGPEPKIDRRLVTKPLPEPTNRHDSGTLQEYTIGRKPNGIPIANTEAMQFTSTPLQNISIERRLVRDLLLIVQGENGSLVSCRDEDANFSVHIDLPTNVHLPLPFHDIVRYVSEVGFLFRIIRKRVDEEDSGIIGQVLQNMCRAIIREMDSYYRSLVTLRGIDNPTDIDNGGAERLTLRKVFVWAENEKPRLRWLARLCEETRPLRGGQILAHLRHRRGSYVSSDIRDMISRILASTAAPVNRMLVRWLSEGVLVDEHKEFFIYENPKVASAMAPDPNSEAVSMEEGGISRGLAGGPNAASHASNRIWWGLYKVQKSQLPGAINSHLAQQALLVGKSISFLRQCCSDSVWVDQRHAPLVSSMTSGSKQLLEADRFSDKDIVEELIKRTKESVCKRLKDLFFERFDLSHHFGAIKRYLLLSQGDFTQALMDSLAPILDADSNILRSNLTGYVDSALQSSSSFNEETDQDILERLDVQILSQVGPEHEGWDVFSLTYRVEDAPLNTVFSEKVMSAYLLIFRFLWKLKRMDHLMSKAYMNLRRFEDDREMRFMQEGWDDETCMNLRALVKRLHFVRMKMTHVVHNLQHYCTVEVLEGSWSVLEKEMETAEDLDAMIHAHAKYLTAIKDQTLLSDRSKYVAMELSAVLDTVLLFDSVHREVCGGLEDFAPQDKREERYEVADRVTELGSKMECIENAFDEGFERLLGALKKHCRMVENCVFLLFRLDYNGYYAKRLGRLSMGETDEDGHEERAAE